MWKYIVLCLALGFAGTADAKRSPRRARAHKPVAQQKLKDVDRADLPPKTNAASDFDKAKAELDDLKTSREIPLVSLDNQENDRENPLKK